MRKERNSGTSELQEGNERQKNMWNELKDWAKVLACAFIVSLLVTSFIKPTLVVGSSMNETLEDKDYLLINKVSYKVGEPKYKDIIVFKTKAESVEKYLIKRVIGEKGDRIRITNGVVYVNEKALHENYISKQKTLGAVDVVVPEGKVFVMGDNRNNSMDSRFTEVGLVDKEQIVGKIMVRLFPFHSIEQ